MAPGFCPFCLGIIQRNLIYAFNSGGQKLPLLAISMATWARLINKIKSSVRTHAVRISVIAAFPNCENISTMLTQLKSLVETVPLRKGSG
jgi:hypothetical protein